MGRPYGVDVPVTDSIHADPLNVADIQRVAQWSAPVITLALATDEIDDAIHQTWRHGGDVIMIDEQCLGDVIECAALLRY